MTRALIAFLVGLGAALVAGNALAVKKLNLLALFEGKAMLYIDGERRMLSVGETSPEGVTLVRADVESALVEIAGRREDLRLGMATTLIDDREPVADDASYGSATVSLWADHSGFFHVDGMINGFPVRFLVDTGATTVAISGDLAARIGLDISQGRRGVASTAGGLTPMVGVSLETVSVGDITLRDVDAGVIMGAFPETPLLGMSFLGQLDMVREGNRMELRRRF